MARSRSREVVASTVYSTSASNWNAGNSIDGGQHRYLNSNGSDNAFYDLTTNTLSHISTCIGYGANLTVKINSAVAGGVANFIGSGTNDKLVTSDAALDLSHSTVSGFTVASSNATGTNFTVHDIDRNWAGYLWCVLCTGPAALRFPMLGSRGGDRFQR